MMISKIKKEKVFGLPLAVFAIFSTVIILAAYIGKLPADYVGTIAYLMVIGGALCFIGSKIPFANEYLGAAVVLPLFVAGGMATYGFIPEYVQESVGVLMKGGFQNVYIAAVLVGSILSLDRETMLKSVARYIPTVIASQTVAIAFLALAGIVTGIGAFEAIFMIGAPTMSGGSGGAIATLPAIYSKLMNVDAGEFAGKFIGYCSIGNVISVLSAAMLAKLLDKSKTLNGHGKILINEANDNNIEDIERPTSDLDYRKLGAGLFISLSFMVAGNLAASLIPQVAALAWTIVIAIAAKAMGLISEEYCNYTNFWFSFMLKNLLPVLIAGIGISSIDVSVLGQYFTLKALFVIIMGIAGAAIGAGIFGRIFGLWPLESAITAAFCSVDLGGSGDLAILSATNRMQLLPFSSISTRIGGALMILEISLLMPLFL